MGKPPTPAPVSDTEALALALRIVETSKFPMLATVENDQPRLRPVSPVRTEGFFVYVANLRGYSKTRQIESNPKVELCYMDEAHDQVRITGIAEVLRDAMTLESIWRENPLLRSYLGTPDNPDLIIYQIRPTRVLFMREWALSYINIPVPQT